MTDKNHNLSSGHSDGYQTLLTINDLILFFNRVGVFEGNAGGTEADPVFLDVLGLFRWVPIKIEYFMRRYRWPR
jgi:hypothetical protein